MYGTRRRSVCVAWFVQCAHSVTSSWCQRWIIRESPTTTDHGWWCLLWIITGLWSCFGTLLLLLRRCKLFCYLSLRRCCFLYFLFLLCFFFIWDSTSVFISSFAMLLRLASKTVKGNHMCYSMIVKCRGRLPNQRTGSIWVVYAWRLEFQRIRKIRRCVKQLHAGQPMSCSLRCYSLRPTIQVV